MKKNWEMHFMNGNPCSWEGDSFDEERDANLKYELDISFAGYSRGCSSALLIFVPTKQLKSYKENSYNKFHYNVFMSDAEDIINHCVNGRIIGTFCFVKKGQNYGLQLVESEAKK